MHQRTLEELAERIRRCTRCPLHSSRTHAVPGEGDPRAGVMLIGEAPGEKEDEEGRPFVGRAGAFLDELLEEVGPRREKLFITSCVKCRPPENRNPRKDELDACHRLWLERQTELINPDLIVLLGKVALKELLGEDGRLSDLHGQVRHKHGRRFLITYHPAAAMRFPEPEAGIREDFRRITTIVGDTMEGG